MPGSPSTATYELLGSFYLGRRYDLDSRKLTGEVVLYDSRDLVTHAVIVGMTGSGKTGLGISLMEEAAIDGVPILAIDPKGDLPNLLLTFPNLAPADFRPWVDEQEAERRSLTLDALAAHEAEAWTKGLADWQQDGVRIKRLREAADFRIYTPGSRAGYPLSILESFAAPPERDRNDDERMAEAVGTTATSLLALVGIAADPVQSREHMLLSTILDSSWRQGEGLDLATIIQRVQKPSVTRVGVLELEAFYPEKDRFALAMRLNGLLAAPGFDLWLQGEAVDVGRLLYSDSGKPRVAIVSIAHLNDAERMFVVTLLLNQVVSWMRAQSGTSSLRALLYMDEVAGYMPPVSNPASKQALLRLMKQARAFGLGVVLSTQNPVDLDYKGLSNAGTWFLGRLQTERDKARLLDGLEGALAGQGPSFDRAATERMLSSLPKRTFYLHDVHEDAPVVFQTRWAMSYLRGPLTKDQIQRLTPREDVAAETHPSPATTAGAPTTDAITGAAGARGTRAATASAPAPSAAVPPVLAPNIEQFFAPAAPAANLAYEPMLYARASVRFSDTKRRVDVTRTVSRRVPFGTGAVAVDWEAGEDVSLDPAELDRAPAGPATFGALPPAAAKAGSYDSWAKDFARALQQTEVLTLFVDEHTGLSSTRDEREADFRARVQLRARELRDAAKDKLRQKYAPKLAALDERIRRADEAIGREQDQKSQQQLQTGVSIVGTVLGTLFGRKTLSMGNLGRATTSARGMGRTMKESEDVKRAEERLEQERQKKAELERDLETDIAALEAAAPDPARSFETLEITPKKTHVTPERVVLLWWPND